MMFNIKIKDIKLLHSYPENQLCKKQMLDVFSYIHTHTHRHTHVRTHTQSHTKVKFIQKKQVIYSIKWQMYSKKTHQTKYEVELL